MGIWSRVGMNKGCPYSAMTQREGASLLYRAGLETGDVRFSSAADQAIALMLKAVAEGGTAYYDQGKLTLRENPQATPSAILNGWIFAVFGLYDGILVSQRSDWELAFEQTIETLKNDLKYYDAGYWSFYDGEGHLASPFYHDLHINLLSVLAELVSVEAFLKVGERWECYRKNKVCYIRAFLTKAYQKLRDPGEAVIVK